MILTFSVKVVPVLNPEEFSRILYKLKRRGNYKIIATSSTAPRKDSLWDERIINDLHDKNRILLFGSEAEGLSRRVLNSADYIVEVPGVGNIESLNVATSAAAVLTMLNRPK
jgi:23S rRNA (guanosine2251-2'-O)-methyltransferase